jgi:exopolyphosphatase/guanosine-5'-triphosphate,3'-diphosphate pyrophosphatase
MEKIEPRWEWRTFGDDLSAEVEGIRDYGNSIDRDSEELYILSSGSNDNTKIRSELMDIKTPVRINGQTKLEQWTVLAKTAFPIHINELVLVYKAFGLALPYFERDQYSYREYLEELIMVNPYLKVVKVKKVRHGCKIDEAIVDVAEVQFDNVRQQTIAVEHVNPELVLQTVAKLGLAGYENINYIKAMKRIFGLKY